MKELWKSIVGYEGFYMISNHGRIKSLAKSVLNRYGTFCKKRERILRPNNSGEYAMVVLCKYGTKKQKLVHRLLALHFIPNPNCKKEVNHIDGKKSNNALDNLEWCTSSENRKHAYKNGLQHVGEKFIQAGRRESSHRKKTISMYDLQGNFIKQFPCKIIAKIETGCHPGNVLSGRDKHTKGVTFRYD